MADKHVPLLQAGQDKSVYLKFLEDRNKFYNKQEHETEREENKDDYKQQQIDSNDGSSQRININTHIASNSHNTKYVHSCDDDTIYKKIRGIGNIKTYLNHFLPPNISLSTVITSFILTPIALLLNISFIIYNFIVLNMNYKTENYHRSYLRIGNKIVVWFEFIGLSLLILTIFISFIFIKLPRISNYGIFADYNFKCIVIDSIQQSRAWSTFKLFYNFNPKLLINYYSTSYSHHPSRLNATNIEKYKKFKKLKQYHIPNEIDNVHDFNNEMRQTMNELGEIIADYETPVCQKNHPLKSQIIVNDENKKIMCSICNVEMHKKVSIIYKCNKCNYLLCDQCYHGDQVQYDFNKIHHDDVCSNTLLLGSSIIMILITSGLLAIGVTSLLLKIAQFNYINDKEISSWSYEQYWTFIAFCNQLWNICNVERVKMDTIYRFIFTEQSGKFTRYITTRKKMMESVIKEALWDLNLSNDTKCKCFCGKICCKICRILDIRGILLAVSMDSKFLHQIIVQNSFDPFEISDILDYKQRKTNIDFDEKLKKMDKNVDEKIKKQKDKYSFKTHYLRANRELNDIDEVELEELNDKDDGSKDDESKDNLSSSINRKLKQYTSKWNECILNILNCCKMKHKQQPQHPLVTAKSLILRYQQKRECKKQSVMYRSSHNNIITYSTNIAADQIPVCLCNETLMPMMANKCYDSYNNVVCTHCNQTVKDMIVWHCNRPHGNNFDLCIECANQYTAKYMKNKNNEDDDKESMVPISIKITNLTDISTLFYKIEYFIEYNMFRSLIMSWFITWFLACLSVIFQWRDHAMRYGTCTDTSSDQMSITYLGFALVTIFVMGIVLVMLFVVWLIRRRNDNNVDEDDDDDHHHHHDNYKKALKGYACIFMIGSSILSGWIYYYYTFMFVNRCLENVAAFKHDNMYWYFFLSSNISFFLMAFLVGIYFLSNAFVLLPYMVIMFLFVLFPCFMATLLPMWIIFDLELIFNSLPQSKHNKQVMILLILSAILGIWYFLVSIIYYCLRNCQGKKYQFSVCTSIWKILFVITLILIYLAKIVFVASCYHLDGVKNSVDGIQVSLNNVIIPFTITLILIGITKIMCKRSVKTNIFGLNWMELWMQNIYLAFLVCTCQCKRINFADYPTLFAAQN